MTKGVFVVEAVTAAPEDGMLAKPTREAAEAEAGGNESKTLDMDAPAAKAGPVAKGRLEDAPPIGFMPAKASMDTPPLVPPEAVVTGISGCGCGCG